MEFWSYCTKRSRCILFECGVFNKVCTLSATFWERMKYESGRRMSCSRHAINLEEFGHQCGHLSGMLQRFRGYVTESLILAICLLVCITLSLLAVSVESDAASLYDCILQLISALIYHSTISELEVELLVTHEVANLWEDATGNKARSWRTGIDKVRFVSIEHFASPWTNCFCLGLCFCWIPLMLQSTEIMRKAATPST